MAITTLDGALAGMKPLWPFGKTSLANAIVGRPSSYWAIAGNPGAGSYDTTLNGVVLSSSSAMVTGQLPFTDPVSAYTYLGRLAASSSTAGMLVLADRIWHNGGFTITSTSVQSITSPTWPARDRNGSTDGEGIVLGLEISAAAGAAAPTITVTYTNSAGTGSRTATNMFVTANSPALGAFYPIGLQGGDLGVRSVESLQLSTSWLSGTMNLVAYRVLAQLELTNLPNAIDMLTGGFQRLYDGTVPYFFWIPSVAATSLLNGSIIYSVG